MENPLKAMHRSPDSDGSGGQEKKEKIGELAYVPIFRANNLYKTMFPEITPLVNQGEEPDPKKIFEEIIKHPNSQIAIDGTCESALDRLSLDDVPKEISQEYIKTWQNGDAYFDVRSYLESLGIQIKNIEYAISHDQEYFSPFSPERAEPVVALLQEQMPNCNRVIISLDHLDDHTGNRNTIMRYKKDQGEELTNARIKELDDLLEKYNVKEKKDLSLLLDEPLKYIRSEKWRTRDVNNVKTQEDIEQDMLKAKESKILIALILAEEIQEKIGVTPEFTIYSYGIKDKLEIDDTTMIISDCHSDFKDLESWGEIKPEQALYMPLQRGINHAQEIGIPLKDYGSEGYALKLRRIFEKNEVS